MQTYTIDMMTLKEQYKEAARTLYRKKLGELNPYELNSVIAEVVNGEVLKPALDEAMALHSTQKVAIYCSIEFLVGRVVHDILNNTGILDVTKQIFAEEGIDINCLEDVDDAALGNGGLGRLAACFIESAATMGYPLFGAGLFYENGLFKQTFSPEGRQVEVPDDWTRYGNPWFKEIEEEAVIVSFRDTMVLAVPCVMPVVGYNTDKSSFGGNVFPLTLWKAVPILGTNESAAKISDYLYPEDSDEEGKKLRIRQEYFFVSATLQRLFSIHMAKHGTLDNIEDYYIFQMNDTHPVFACLEFIRLLKERGYTFDQAFAKAKKCFAYTNHTIMSEALEKWSIFHFKSILPDLFKVIEELNWVLIKELEAKEEFQMEYQGRRVTDWDKIHPYELFRDGTIYMGRIACFVGCKINGVAEVHSQIIKDSTLHGWYQLYPERFNNKTNGITQRRWVDLVNKSLSLFLDKYAGEGWQVNLDLLKNLENYADNVDVLKEFAGIKYEAKVRLAEYIKKHEGIEVDPNSIFDCQVKRIHEYKRQLMNALRILYIYKQLKAGKMKDFYKTTFIIGGKAAAGFAVAKEIIALLKDIQEMVNNDPDVNDKMQVVFLTNFNVSYGEKVYPGANFSEQISTVGTEASGTGNMKFMVNGAPTIGTLDGANIEIVAAAGAENNYIFGEDVKTFEESKRTYWHEGFLRDNQDLVSLINMLKGREPGLKGQYWDLTNILEHYDRYYVMYDLRAYINASLKAFYDYAAEMRSGNMTCHTRKALMNTANSGRFSSDRTVREYAEDIWHIKPINK